MKPHKRRTTSAPYTKAGERPGTRKSRTKPHREASTPALNERTWLCLPHMGNGLPALEAYIKANPLTKHRGWADPKNPRNMRVMTVVYRINGTLRYPVTVKRLTGLLGFLTEQDLRDCLHAGQRTEQEL